MNIRIIEQQITKVEQIKPFRIKLVSGFLSLYRYFFTI